MTTPASAVTESANETSHSPSASELFTLTDEQILEIEPDVAEPLSTEQPFATGQSGSSASSSLTEHGARNTEHASAGPPPWLARQMNDPWSGDEARELWNGVQQARQEAAAYREVFPKPEEARSAADRARALEDIDTAFFGGAGKSTQEITAGRTALAQRMLREDPAAFREMVFAGLRLLEESAQPGAALNGTEKPLAAQTGNGTSSTHPQPQDAQLAAYRSFEKFANEELERGVGGAIQRSLEQALPSLSRGDRSAGVAARLQQNVRDQVETALKSDQQLGEQLARVLSARRFDEATRTQVVRLINDRAQQLVPVAARRVIQEWTQTAFAAHRGKGTQAGANGSFAPATAPEANAAQPRSLASSSSASSRGATSRASGPAVSARAAAADRAERDVGLAARSTPRPNGRAVDYHRLTDEQILDL